MMKNTLLLSLAAVTVRRMTPVTRLLGPFSLELMRGERLMITGPSGCGKTTLLRVVAGLEHVASGKIKFADRVRLAYVFQEPRLLPWQRVIDNVRLPLLAAGVPEDEARERAQYWLNEVGLGASIEVWPLTLSGGMAQRVNLARAMAMQPDVLLLDEPFSSLEASARAEMLALTDAHSGGTGILHVTHHPEETRALATRTLALK